MSGTTTTLLDQDLHVASLLHSDAPTTLLVPVDPLVPSGGLTPLPLGGQTLVWKGGQWDNDPTQAGNWDPAVAPVMAANQTLVMNDGTMNLNGGNLAANQLHVSTPDDKTGTINLKDHGTLDLNIPDTAIPNIKVALSGGGEATTNIFTGPTGDSDINISIDASKLDLMANMSFGKLSVHGSGTAWFQGDSHLNGTSVILDTKLGGFGDIELASAGSHPGRIELTKDNVPVGLTVNVHDNNGVGGSNGLIFDKGSTDPSGHIQLDDAFVKIRLEATSYTMQGGEFNLFKNGVKIDTLNVSAAPGSNPLQVGSNANGVYIYNASPSTMPLGAGNGLGGGGGGGGMMLTSLVGGGGDTLTSLPMHS